MIKVHTLDLCETLCDNVCLVLLNSAVGSPFDAEDPLNSNNLVAFWLRDNVVDVQIFPYLHLLFAYGKPFSGIWAGHGLIISLWLWGLSIGDVGAVAIR